MSEQSPHSNDPTSLVVVESVTIEHFEHEQHELGEMYQQLFETNPDLALFMRRRVAQIAPNLTDREAQSKLALELVSLIIRQQGITGLGSMWSLEVVEPDANDHSIVQDKNTPPAA